MMADAQLPTPAIATFIFPKSNLYFHKNRYLTVWEPKLNWFRNANNRSRSSYACGGKVSRGRSLQGPLQSTRVSAPSQCGALGLPQGRGGEGGERAANGDAGSKGGNGTEVI